MKETGEQNMRSSKWYAILLTIVLVMSGCCPANAITAAAAETNSVEENAEEETAVPETEPEEEDTASANEEVEPVSEEGETDEVAEEAGSVAVDAPRTEEDAASEAVSEEEADIATETGNVEVVAEDETADEEADATDPKEEAADREEVSDEEELAEEESVVPEGGASSDEMFAAYVDSEFGIGKKDSHMLKARRPSAGSRLTGVSRIIYDYISAEIVKISNGERSSTKFSIPVEDLGLEKGKWYKEDLGVDTIRVYDPVLEKNVLTPEATEAAYEKLGVYLPDEFEKSLNALLADYPYQLYWFNKVKGVSLSIFVHASTYIRVADDYTMTFAVNEEYEDPDFYNVVDLSIGETVRASAAYAASIVEQHAGEDDYDKLVSYRDEICRLTSYNYSDFDSSDYGDPWQIIWVFDQDPKTKVVCEGYSKAFQYLFNLSTFENDLGCLLITGDVDFGNGFGGHMWNVVSMDDDRNYLVDVTNCDSGTVGSDRLFMIGGKGTPQEGYTVETGYVYYYDEDALSVWDMEELSLCNEHARYYPCWRAFGEWETVVAPTYTSEGLRRNRCSECGMEVEESMPMMVPTSVEELNITGISAKTYTGEPLTQDLVVMDGDDVLVEGVHYTVEYNNNTESTEDTPASVTITGIDENGYTGTRTEEFRIGKASNAITLGTSGITKVYSTSKRTYTIGAEALGGNLTYSSNKDGVQVSSDGKVTISAGFIGKAIITVTAGNSNYKTATKRVPVTVNPTMTCILSLISPKAGQMLVTYKKNTIGTGYQIQFSLNKDFSPATGAMVTSNTTLTRKVGNLQKGQKYYVRIRTYKLVDGAKYYSAWSTIKAVRIKK